MSELDWAKGPAAPAASDITVQGSEAWRAWRGKGLGSSDAPVLLGWSPWKTLEQLVLEKQGKWKPTFGEAQQRAMDRGKRLEPVIRAWYERTHGKGKLFPDGIFEDKHLRGSFDGICRDAPNEDGSAGRLIEIKAPNRDDHELARAGLVPKKYVPQVQWLLMLSGLLWADYVSYGSDDTYAVVQVKRDVLMQEELRRRAGIVWTVVENNAPCPTAFVMPWIRPAEALGIDLGSVGAAPVEEQAAIEELVMRAVSARKEAAAADARYEAIKEQLKAWLGDRSSADVAGVRIEWQEKKGLVDYAKVPQLQGVDLEPFRKKPTRSFIVREPSP